MQSSISSETKSIIAIIAVLTIIFSFNDGNPKFIANLWLKNFFYVLLLSSISFLTLVLGYKLAARYYESKATIRLAYIQRFWFSREAEIKKIEVAGKKVQRLYLGVFLAIFAMLVSAGKFFFTAFYTFDSSTSRLGHRWRNVTNFEEAIISFSGLIASLILLMLFKLSSIDKGITILTWLILFNLLPLSNLPGGKIFFGSRVLYILTIILFAFILFLLPLIPLAITIPLSIIIALSIAYFYFRYIEYGK